MKRGMITGLIVVSLFSLVGCNESSKEVVIEDREEKEGIVVDKIKNEPGEVYYLKTYLNDEYYLLKGIPEMEEYKTHKITNVYEKNLYRLNENNEFIETNIDIKDYSMKYDPDQISFVDTEKDSPITKARYINNKTSEEKILDLNLGDVVNSDIQLVYGKEKVAYLSQYPTDTKHYLKILDIETNKLKKVDKVFKGSTEVMYAEDYYALEDGTGKLYKLREEKESFKVEEEIDLIKEFNIKLDGDGFYVNRIFIKENGEVYLEGFDNNRKTDHTDSCGQALFRYNLKTREKGRINYKLEKDMIILDYNVKSDYIVLESIADFDTKTSNGKIYIGKVANDKIEIIEEIEIKSDGDTIQCVDTLFNDKGNELLIHYTKTKNEKVSEEYLKV
ncbi:MAG: hypothetical protein ACRC28_00060, partial [Clostridium sp.]|uniref:hypothetical protein n=1 Tax=Clostridium sp. TaxID=1506 RepID=UPI003F2FB1BE